MNTSNNISKRLRELRLNLNLTMKDVAEKLSIPTSTYRDWEYGSSIKGEPYFELAKILQVSPLFLMTGIEIKQDELINSIKKIQIELSELSDFIELAFLDNKFTF